jgi:ribosomal protein L24
MWLLHLLPTSLILWIVNIAMIVGLLGILVSFFIKFIPFINIYRTPIQIVSIIVFCSGIYWYGGYTTEMMWRDQVAQMEAKVAESEAKSKKVNKVIQKVYVDRVKVVKQDVVVVQEKIREISNTIDKDCKITPEAIDLLNQAARRKPTVEVEPLKKDDKQ